MDSANIIKIILEELAKQVSQLSAIDIQKIESGSHELLVKLVRKKSDQSGGEELSVAKKDEILSCLNKCNSREEGHAVISNALRNKSELEQFAKHLDVLILKQDKVDQIKDKIIEATVGAILRSNAIQGKNITRP
jgi:hypothetical protein